MAFSDIPVEAYAPYQFSDDKLQEFKALADDLDLVYKPNKPEVSWEDIASAL